MHFLQPVQPTVLKTELSQHSFHKMYNADNLHSVFLEHITVYKAQHKFLP
jgi:hypothetical protein